MAPKMNKYISNTEWSIDYVKRYNLISAFSNVIFCIQNFY